MSVPAKSKPFTPCVYCPSVDLRLRSPKKPSVQADLEAGILHRKLFHKHCRKCVLRGHGDGKGLGVALCAWCRHLRIYHLLRCDIRRNEAPVKGVYVYPFREESSNCDFCQFLIRCRRYTPHDLRDGVTESETRETFIISFEGSKKDETVRLCINEAISHSHPCDPSERPLYAEGYMESINWALINSWLSASSQPTKRQAKRSTTVKKHLVDVRVIDVDQQCVAPLPDHANFVALSYVWGVSQDDQLQLSTGNLAELEKRGSLTRHSLPLTITDSMEVCRRVGERYLWIDRLCILQDGNSGHKTKQLDQMSIIYQRATFTIVAAAGEDTYHGLPGVSTPRKANQMIIPFRNFAVVERIPSFYNLVERSKWYTRGWTFQEQQASTRCLYFTEHGVIHTIYDDHAGNIHGLYIEEESTSFSRPQGSLVTVFGGTGRIQFYHPIVASYTTKTLTFPSDILRAISGALHQIYGSRTFFGLPWSDFDQCLLWHRSHWNAEQIEPSGATPLPSWSWISSLGKKQYDHFSRPLALAYWAKVLVSSSDALCPSVRTQVHVAQPVEADRLAFDSATASTLFLTSYIVAGLACDSNCLSTEVPQEMRLDCSREEYTRRLRHRWPDYTSYWLDTVGRYQSSQIFTGSDIKLAAFPGRLMVRTQKARFAVSLNTAWDETPPKFNPQEWIRDDAGRFVGHLQYDQNNGVRQSKQGDERADFILLSTVSTGYIYDTPNFRGYLQHSHIPDAVRRKKSYNELFACPCLRVSPDRKEGSEASHAATELEHFEECPNHADFLKPGSAGFEAACASGRQPVKDDLGKRQFAKHFEQVSYFDSHGTMMHAWDSAPALNVLMIRPSTGKGEGTGVYQRVGIGEIYLKRWLEANPVFETIVLE